MKRLLWILATGGILISATLLLTRNLRIEVDESESSRAGMELLPPGGPEDVVVRTVELKWPENKEAWAQVLWDAFANKPEEMRFSHNGTRGWKKSYDIHAESLIRKAKGQALDENSLRLILAHLKKDDANPRVAYLPVGAYWTEFDGKPGWIVVMKWENGSDDSGEADSRSLCHIHIVLIDPENFETVADATCG